MNIYILLLANGNYLPLQPCCRHLLVPTFALVVEIISILCMLDTNHAPLSYFLLGQKRCFQVFGAICTSPSPSPCHTFLLKGKVTKDIEEVMPREAKVFRPPEV